MLEINNCKWHSDLMVPSSSESPEITPFLVSQEALQEIDQRSFEQLEAVPQITFDRNVGKKYDFVDFDYVEYDEQLRSRGLTDKDIEATSIHFKRNTLFSLSYGSYNLLKRNITVSIGHKNHGRANKALAHETEHRIDHAHKVSRRDSLLRVVPQSAGITLFAFGIIGTLMGLKERNAEQISESRELLFIGAGNIAVADFLYWNSSEERKARAAGKNAPKILRLIK